MDTATTAAPCSCAYRAIASGNASEPSSTLATNSTGLAVSGESSVFHWAVLQAV